MATPDDPRESWANRRVAVGEDVGLYLCIAATPQTSDDSLSPLQQGTNDPLRKSCSLVGHDANFLNPCYTPFSPSPRLPVIGIDVLISLDFLVDDSSIALLVDTLTNCTSARLQTTD
ncbi:MAG TPA: hypothetical protein V6C85_28360 [Allocoleopsis sp.]